MDVSSASPVLVTSTEELVGVCQRLSKHSYVTVDTEFMSGRTYWAQLCLIQMASDAEVVIVDPLAQGIDLGPFYELMMNSSVLKVFHDPREDFRIFQKACGRIPSPVFDTSVAAQFCGYERTGYKNLAQSLLGLHVDKGQQRSNWNRRPLSESQLKYCSADVTHLREMYKRLELRLGAASKKKWFSEEMVELIDPKHYTRNSEDAWKRAKLSTRSKRELAILIEVARIRDTIARSCDIPLSFVFSDNMLKGIVKKAPQDEAQLCLVEGVNKKFAQSNTGYEVLRAVQAGAKKDVNLLPKVSDKDAGGTAATTALSRLLEALLMLNAKRSAVCPSMVATSDDLKTISSSVMDVPPVRAMQGWRKEVFGKDALALKGGHLGLVVRDGCVQTFNVGVHSA